MITGLAMFVLLSSHIRLAVTTSTCWIKRTPHPRVCVWTYIRTMKDMSVPEEQNPKPVLSWLMEMTPLKVFASAG